MLALGSMAHAWRMLMIKHRMNSTWLRHSQVTLPRYLKRKLEPLVLPTAPVTLAILFEEIAMHLSLYVNLVILASKAYIYIKTLSLAILAALLDSVLDVVSQLVLYYMEQTSNLRSSEIYPAG